MNLNFFDALPSVIRLSATSGAQPVSITFTPALPPAVRAQIATQNADQPFTLTVSNASGNKLTFTSPTGETFTAVVNPALPQGTQLQLSAASVLPPQPQAGTPAIPAALVLQAKILPPATATPQGTAPSQGTGAPTPPLPPVTSPQPQPTIRPVLTLTIPATSTTSAVLQNLITTTILQATAPLPASPQAPQLPVPAGPVAVTLPTTLPANLTGIPLTLKPTAPMQPNGTQTATLVTAIPTPAQPPLRITLNLGVPLPTTSTQPAIILPAVNPDEPPVLILTGNNPTLPTPPKTGLQIQLPTLQIEAEPSQPTTQQPRSPEPQIPVSGRVLPPVQGQPVGTQTVLLATGTIAVLKSPQPLPTGSIIVADLPITPNTGLQRVLMSDAQSQPQPNTAQQAQTAAPVAPQTTQAVLSAGMLIQGTITGQNEQGQPLLTITQPGTLSGQTVPLTITDNTALLPIGAQLSIKVEGNLTATILGLILPPQTQAAFTLGTIGARWEGLQQALQVLQQQAPAQAANLRASLPQLANLLPGILAFTNALRTNRTEDAFDTEATRLLKSMGIDLSSDLSQLSQLQQRPSSQSEAQWRGTLFPYVEAPGEDPRQGGFFWRREKSDNPRAPTNTRFVVEVEMSKLGPVQLDGLITYPEVWLKLRRTSAPENDFTTGLQSLVQGLLTEYGLSGGIAVETTSTFPVNPRAELLAQTENPLPTSA